MRSSIEGLIAAVMLLTAGCGGESADAAATPIRDGLPEQTATVPASPCDWISVSEVEAVVGKLNGTPRAERGGCFYPLPMDSITTARRAKASSRPTTPR